MNIQTPPLDTAHRIVIHYGNWLFRYREMVFPIVVVLLFAGFPQVVPRGDYYLDLWMDLLGLLVALDTYIHHLGSQTFKGLGIDTEQALRQNFSRFQHKWGAERTAGYRLPGRHDTVPAPGSLTLPRSVAWQPGADGVVRPHSGSRTSRSRFAQSPPYALRKAL